MKEYAKILKAAFDPFFESPLDDWMGFAELCKVERKKKNSILKKAHSAEHFMYFIISGSAGVFLWKEQNQVCLDIAYENHFFCDMMSMLSGQVTPLETMVLEDAELLVMPQEKYKALGNTAEGLILTRIAAESSFMHKQQQQIDLLTKTNEERYIDFLVMFPGIVNRVSQKHIASYLGITPQSFSRLKKKSRI